MKWTGYCGGQMAIGDDLGGCRKIYIIRWKGNKVDVRYYVTPKHAETPDQRKNGHIMADANDFAAARAACEKV